MFDQYPDIVAVDDIREMLNIGKSSVYGLLQDNRIHHVKVGRKYIVPKTAVIAFANTMCYNDGQVINGRLSLVKKGEC